MNRLSLALSIITIVFGVTAVHAQSPVRLSGHHRQDDQELRAIAALKRLDAEVIIYRSLGDLEEGRRLASVPLAEFERELFAVTAEVDPILKQLPDGKLKANLENALATYHDGLFWWRKIDRPRVIEISALCYRSSAMAADTAFISTIPYTVAIHWRQAHTFLSRAEKLN